jgi:hypothetical protein
MTNVNKITSLLIAACVALMVFGCATSKPNLEPLPLENLHDLLHATDKYAYKSVTKKDYEQKDFN